MSSGYEVIQADIRDAAADLQDVADGVASADPSTLVSEVSTALPGSQSATAADALVTTWRDRFRTWSQDAGDRSTTLDTKADNYDAAEHEAVTRLLSIPLAQRPR